MLQRLNKEMIHHVKIIVFLLRSIRKDLKESNLFLIFLILNIKKYRKKLQKLMSFYFFLSYFCARSRFLKIDFQLFISIEDPNLDLPSTRTNFCFITFWTFPVTYTEQSNYAGRGSDIIAGFAGLVVIEQIIRAKVIEGLFIFLTIAKDGRYYNRYLAYRNQSTDTRVSIVWYQNLTIQYEKSSNLKKKICFENL